MLLAVDVGNSQISLGLIQPDAHKIIKNFWIPTRLGLNSTTFLNAFLETNIPLPLVKVIAISSVVPHVSQVILPTLKDFFQKSSNHAPQVFLIQNNAPYCFQIDTEAPDKTGTDFLVNAQAAIQDYGFPCLVVDAGTATTFCAISKNSAHQAVFLGSAISLGLNLSMKTLANQGAQLFSVQLAAPETVIGKNTTHALQSGLVLGHAQMIDGMIRRMRQELLNALKIMNIELKSTDIPVICTGGLHFLFKNLTQEITHFDPMLTLRGISYVTTSLFARQP